jgi:hypothetical protein
VTVGWRSTTIRMAEEHCAAALDYHDRSEPYDRSGFAIGTAAHAVLEDVGKESARRGDYLRDGEADEVAYATCRRLMSEGRNFEGEAEPPLPPAKVYAGRDLALSYQAVYPLPPTHRYEEPLAVTRDWLPCPYGPTAWLRGRIDAVGTEVPGSRWWEDEEGADAGGPTLIVSDYKSSWIADEEELRTLQRKIQAVLSWDRWGEGHEMLRLVVVNFRLQREYALTVAPRTPEGETVMSRWRRDITEAISAWSGPRIPSPGPGCFRCPYLLGACKPAQEYLWKAYGTEDAEDLARIYAVAEAARDSLKPPLLEATADGPLSVDGAVIGTVAKTERSLSGDAHEKLAAAWNRRARDASLETEAARVPGLLKALGIGVAQAESLAKHLHPKGGGEEAMAARRRLIESVTATRVQRRFGVHRKEEGNGEAGEG